MLEHCDKPISVLLAVLVLTAVLAYTVAALSPNMDVANALLPTYVSTLLFFGGFLFTFDAIPPWWKWYSYINPLRYARQRNLIHRCKVRGHVSLSDEGWLDTQEC